MIDQIPHPDVHAVGDAEADPIDVLADRVRDVEDLGPVELPGSTGLAILSRRLRIGSTTFRVIIWQEASDAP